MPIWLPGTTLNKSTGPGFLYDMSYEALSIIFFADQIQRKQILDWTLTLSNYISSLRELGLFNDLLVSFLIKDHSYGHDHTGTKNNEEKNALVKT